MNHQELIERLRVLEIDHEPNGWPAIQMRDISAMCYAIESLLTENARLKAECDDIKQVQFPRKLEAVAVGWKKQLAASQAYAEQLREALTTCVCAMQDYQAGIGITEMFDKGERLGRKALAVPRDTSALDAYVAEKVKEYGDEARRQMQHATKAVWQRDLAVYGLNEAEVYMTYCKPIEAMREIRKALSAIKESETK